MTDPRRDLPSVDHLLREPAIAALLAGRLRGASWSPPCATRSMPRARRRAGPPDDWAGEVRERLALRTGRRRSGR